MSKELTPTQTVYILVGIIVLLIICYATTVCMWIENAYDYDVPTGDIVNTNTNVNGGIK